MYKFPLIKTVCSNPYPECMMKEGEANNLVKLLTGREKVAEDHGEQPDL